MASSPARSALLFVIAIATAAGQELPKPTGATELNSKLILTDVPDAPLLNELPGAASSPNEPPAPMDVVKLEGAVENAKRSAAFRERMWKAGVLSKLEAEQAAMKVVRLTKDLANARLEAAKREVNEKRKQGTADDAAKAAVADAETRLTTVTTAAQNAATKWDEAQRAAAELRVQRERKLVSLGADPKMALKQAETALQKLKATPVP
ncbi:MAG TPA: hypothetical protein VGM54_18890 [Chthoniobacter sp.]|jgi:hypothetical protein